MHVQVRWMAVVGLVALAAVAGAEAAEARRAPRVPGCSGELDDKQLADAVTRLGSSTTVAGALADLRGGGDRGCAAMVTWLSGSAQGVHAGQLAEVIGWVGRSDADGALEQLLVFAESDHESVRTVALAVLEERLVSLDADEVDLLVTSLYEDVRVGAVAILAGHHAERVWREAGSGGQWEETRFVSARELPRLHEIGMGRLSADRSPVVRARVAEVVERMLIEQRGVGPSYPGLLLALAADPEHHVAAAAAAATGRVSPDNGMLILDALLQRPPRGRPDVFDALLAGLRRALDAGHAAPVTLHMLRKLETHGPEEHREAAAALAADVERTLAAD